MLAWDGMRDFLMPTRPKLWVALLVWSSYWLIGKLDSLVAFPIVSLIYPNYLAELMGALQPQTDKVMSAMVPNTIAVANAFLAVHITVAALAGYLGACVIVLLLKNSKAI